MELSRRQRIALVILAAVLTVSTPIIAENFTGGSNTAGAGGEFDANSGPLVELGTTIELKGGQPANSESINLSKADDAYLNVSSTGDGPVVIVDTINSTDDGSGYTNVSGVSGTGTHNITLQPRRKNFTKIGGGIDTFKFKDIKVEDGKVDLRYTASSTATIVVETNATDGTAYGLVDPDTLEGLDVAVADADGTVDFTDVPSRASEQEVRIEKLGTLTIRNESTPHGTVTGCTVEVKFFEDETDDPTIEERTDSDNDGQVDLTGLPIDEEFSVTATCDGYHNRTVVLNDLSQQETMFLLDKDVTSVENRFTVEDRTGDFPPEDTEVILQKAINRSEYGGSPSGFSWTNIAGDDLGADEAFTVDLEDEARYRIKVQNQGGDSRILGSYIPTTTGTINLVIGEVNLDPAEDDEPTWTANWTNTSGTEQVNFEYNDSQDKTTTIWLEIYEYNNQSNELLSNTSFTNGPYGTFTNTQNVPAGDEDTVWVVVFTFERTDEKNIHGELVVGPQQPVLPELPDYLVSIIFVGTIWLVAGLFSQLNGHIGALVVAGMGALFYFVNLAPPELGAPVMILSLITAGVVFVNENRGGGL